MEIFIKNFLKVHKTDGKCTTKYVLIYNRKNKEDPQNSLLEEQMLLLMFALFIMGKKGKIKMGNDKFLELCKKTILDYFNNRTDKTDKFEITEKDIFIVWSVKALQNNKALVSTTVSDGMYYELTYNGDKKELYLDAYKKWKNKCIKIED